jgi:extradiol dioxygenase family protein
MKTLPVFHLAYPVKDKETTRRFYRDVLRCKPGREAESWIDFNFFGHQVSFHVRQETVDGIEPTSEVDGKDVPLRHFGAILDWGEWHDLKDRLIGAGISFVIQPYIRFRGETGEQATMFSWTPAVTH